MLNIFFVRKLRVFFLFLFWNCAGGSHTVSPREECWGGQASGPSSKSWWGWPEAQTVSPRQQPHLRLKALLMVDVSLQNTGCPAQHFRSHLSTLLWAESTLLWWRQSGDSCWGRASGARPGVVRTPSGGGILTGLILCIDGSPCWPCYYSSQQFQVVNYLLHFFPLVDVMEQRIFTRTIQMLSFYPV